MSVLPSTIENTASIYVQRIYRGYVERKHFELRIIAALLGVQIITSDKIKTLETKVESVKVKKENQAASLIQYTYRRYRNNKQASENQQQPCITDHKYNILHLQW